MINFKRAITAVAVVGGLTMAVASNGMKRTDPQSQKWFLYDPMSGGGINNPENYTPTGNDGQDVPSCNEPQGPLCAIEATPDQTNPNQPDLATVSQSRKKAE